jgi:RNA polymerase sigma-70 factor (ECF subfamily)
LRRVAAVTDQALAEAIRCARVAHPDVRADEAAFALHLQKHAGATRPADLYLAFACAQRDPAALRAFDELHLTPVGDYLAHLRQPGAFVDEVRQRLRERLLLGTRLLDYSGRGALGGWVRVAAVRVALDLLDANKERDEGENGLDDSLVGTADPELLVLRERYLPQFRAAFQRAVDALQPRERSLLRLYLVDGLSIGRIGELFGKSRATVGRMVVDCREKLLEETKAQLGVLTGASEDEVRSLIRLLQSQLDVSVQRLLQREEPAQ